MFIGDVGQDTRDICYATQNRQNAVLALLDQIELLLVIGSANSSNANRLCEIGAAKGVPAHLIDGPSMLDRDWLKGVASVGITAGASTPEVLVQDTIARLATWRRVMIEEFPGREESVHFRVPDRLTGQLQAIA